jgi:hypothetical protein
MLGRRSKMRWPAGREEPGRRLWGEPVIIVSRCNCTVDSGASDEIVPRGKFRLDQVKCAHSLRIAVANSEKEPRGGLRTSQPQLGELLCHHNRGDCGRECDVAAKSYLVIPDAVLPAACANTVKGRAGTVSSLERTAVQRQTHDDLVRRNSVAGVILHGSIGAEGSCLWPLLRGENVGLVACDLVPRSGVIVRHQVPEVKVAVHLLERQVGKVCRSGW